MNERRWLWIGVALPVLGVAALIARAEVKSRSGETFRVGITGYDPRDLLHGHYLQYRYAWDWQGEHACGSVGTTGSPDPFCCICLTSRGSHPAIPSARQLDCEDVQACDAWVSGSAVSPPLRYFIPEEKAARLEQALGSQRAQVDLTVSDGGHVSVGELYLEGRPWREVVP